MVLSKAFFSPLSSIQLSLLLRSISLIEWDWVSEWEEMPVVDLSKTCEGGIRWLKHIESWSERGEPAWSHPGGFMTKEGLKLTISQFIGQQLYYCTKLALFEIWSEFYIWWTSQHTLSGIISCSKFTWMALCLRETGIHNLLVCRPQHLHYYTKVALAEIWSGVSLWWTRQHTLSGII